MTKTNPYDTNRYRRSDERLKHPYDLSRGFVSRQSSHEGQAREIRIERIRKQIKASPYDASVSRLF